MPSAGAELIVREAMKDDPRPLHVAFLGPLTDMASAILMEPRIAQRNVRVVWIGGGYWPVGEREYNLSNDIAAANVVARSGIEIWQIPMTVYRHDGGVATPSFTSASTTRARSASISSSSSSTGTPDGRRPIEHRSLGDSPAIGVIMYPECGVCEWVPGPEYNPLMNYVHTGRNRPVRLYQTSTSASSWRTSSPSSRASPAASRSSRPLRELSGEDIWLASNAERTRSFKAIRREQRGT